MCLLIPTPWGPVWNSKWWRMCVSSSHPPHMNHCGPSLRIRRVYYIPPHQAQCGTLTGGEYLSQPATHPTWTIVDLVWEIRVSTTSHPIRTSVELWLVENMCVIQAFTPHESLMTDTNIGVVSVSVNVSLSVYFYVPMRCVSSTGSLPVNNLFHFVTIVFAPRFFVFE